MTPRERVIASLNHQEPDILPMDLGSTLITGIHVSSLHKIKVALGLIGSDEPVKVSDPFQMLGEVDNELRTVLGIDTIALEAPKNFFGFKNEGWKPWTFFDGTPLLVPEQFNTTPDAEGDIYQYPEGDPTVPASGKMPGGGFYHDAVIRQQPIRDEADLRVEDQVAEYGPLSEEDLRYYEREAKRLYEETEFAVVSGGVPGTNLGDIALVPGPSLKEPAGIRDVEEWYISLATRKDYLQEVFARMTEIGLQNLKSFHQAVGSRVQVIVLSGTDFGSQSCPFISPVLYRNLFKPFHQKMNQWIHENTNWKVFIHTCGSIWDLLPDLSEAGFDILNPVQISAHQMVPAQLKKEFGKQFTFWGGGVNTQTTLPFGSPEEIKQEARELIETFQSEGGFIFAAVHNIQAGIPLENLLALFEVVNEYR